MAHAATGANLNPTLKYTGGSGNFAQGKANSGKVR
jgi:hypothetical protein